MHSGEEGCVRGEACSCTSLWRPDSSVKSNSLWSPGAPAWVCADLACSLLMPMTAEDVVNLACWIKPS